MSNIDDRIVSISFDNEAFQRRLAETLVSLDALNETIKMVGAKQGLSELADATQSFDISGMAEGIDNISSKFSALGAIGFTVIQSLTTSAMDFASGVLSKITEPIQVGGKRRAENIEQAKFLFRGLGMDIEETMASAKEAVLGTAYGLDAAAKTAAQLGGSGMKAGKEMTGALRGIAGVAAMTNTSFEEMSDVFTSAAGKGTVSGYELQRIGQRGLNAAAALAKQWGMTEQQVREAASNGEISFKKFAEGMNDAFGEHATKANETYTGSLANMRAAFSRLGASFFGRHMEQQRDLFNTLTPVIDKVHTALTPLINALVDMKGIGVGNLIKTIGSLDLTGLTAAIPNFAFAIRHAFDGVGQIIGQFKLAFRDLFPPSTTSLLLTFSEALRRMTERIKMGEGTLASIKSVFRGFFSAIAIGIEIVKGIYNTVKELFSSLADASGLEGGGVLAFFANMGESVVNLKKALVDTGAITNFFKGLTEAIKDPTIILEKLREMLGALKDSFMNLFGEKEIPGVKGAGESFGRVGDRIDHLRETINRISEALEPLVKVIDWVWVRLKTWFTELGQKLAAVMGAGDFNAAVDLLNAGLIGGILVILKRFVDGGIKLNPGGIMDKVVEALDGVKETLSAMQAELKSKALLRVAFALGIMTLSIVALSLIDSVALTKALAAISVAMGQLLGAMAILDKIGTGRSAAKIALLAGGMILLSVAVGILAISIAALSRLSWEELAKGLVGVGAAMAIMITAINLLSTDTGAIVGAGLAMIGIAIGLRILASAMQEFAEMSWADMAKGLVGVAGGLVYLVNALNTIDSQDMVKASLAIIGISVAMFILAKAMQEFAEMSWGEMAKGLIGVGVGLGIIVALTNMMPAGGLVGIGVGLIGVAIALRIMGEAVEKMGEMPLGEMAKGLGALAAMLLILVVATNAMTGAMAGAAAMLVVSGALLVLSNVLIALSKLKLSELAIALGAIAGVLIVLGVGSIVLAGMIPTMAALGSALILIGAGFALFGVGAMLMAKALETLAESGEAGLVALQGAMLVFIGNMPKLIATLIESIIESITEITEAIPTLIKAIKVILSHVLETIIELAPKIADALIEIILAGLKLMEEIFPRLVEVGFKMVMSILQGFDENIEEIVNRGSNIIIKFLEGLAERSDDLTEAALNMVIAFLNAIAERMGDVVFAGMTVLLTFLRGIAENIGMVITEATNIIVNFVAGIAQNIHQVVTAGADILIQLLFGIASNIIRVADAVTTIITAFIFQIGENTQRIIDAGFFVLTQILWGITNNTTTIVTEVGTMVTQFIDAIGGETRRIMDAGVAALLDFLAGVRENGWAVVNAFALTAASIVDSILDAIVWTADAVGQMVLDFLEELNAAIEKYQGPIQDAGWELAKTIADGFTLGMASKASGLIGAVTNPIGTAINMGKGLLESNSPSKVFIRLGQSVGQGFAIGVKKEGDQPVKEVANIVKNVITRFQETMDKAQLALPILDDVNPVITPVLDLTRVQAASRTIDDMFKTATITPDASFEKAKTLALVTNNQNGSDDPPAPTGPTEVTFEQNIYAPTELSTADIYRQTKSQLVLAKEELGIS